MAITNSTTTPAKEIRYDRETRDYACFLGGELIGYRATYGEAEVFISETYTQQLEDQARVIPQTVEQFVQSLEVGTYLDSHLSDTQIAQLADGSTVMGTFDTDGTPFTVYVDRGDSRLHAGDDGCISITVNGKSLDCDTAQLAAWRAVFASDVPDRLLMLAQQWAGGHIAALPDGILPHRMVCGTQRYAR
jgi:hypothetical protein